MSSPYEHGFTNAYSAHSSPTTGYLLDPRKPSPCTRTDKRVESEEVAQGRILWLPMKHELPQKAVRRAHGKGAVEEGIYNHPIVIISRPAEEDHTVHFHLITSFQGKRLDEIYGKPNEFHASRRSWYLPVYPAPEHPDALSKKSKKRFPTLDLAEGAVLRWDSYVNLRHVYKIDWTLLRPYSNPDTPNILQYHFEKESTIRMLAKSRFLTTYETGPQYQSQIPLRMPIPYVHNATIDRNIRMVSPISNGSFGSDRSTCSPVPQPAFLGLNKSTTGGLTRSITKDPPENGDEAAKPSIIRFIFRCILRWPWIVINRIWAWLRR